MITRKTRWFLILVILFLIVPTVASASAFTDANYRKNRIFNLRTTVKGGTTTYGTFTQSLLARPNAAESDKAEQLGVDDLGSTPVVPVTGSNNGSDTSVKWQNPSGADNPMLINSHANFEPAKSFGGLGYNLKTNVTNSSGTLATNRLALLSNPFAAIFGNVFAGACTQDTSDPSGKSCRKLSFGQKGFGVTENNFGGANFSYQIPGYAIQSDSILKWDKNSGYGNEMMKGVIESLLPTAYRRDCSDDAKTINFSDLSFAFLPNVPDENCSLIQLSSMGFNGSGRTVVINSDLTLQPKNGILQLRGVGTIIVNGNLNINKNITYGSTDSSVGFIVLGRNGLGGTITIADGVNKVQGMFYAPGSSGRIVISPGSSKLLMKGIFATNTFELNKRTDVINSISGPDGENLNKTIGANIGANITNNYNVAILYDPRIQKNPPPGFKYGITSTSSSTQSLFEPAAP